MSNKKIIANASWIMLGRIFQLGLTFITTMLVTRYLGPKLFGQLNYVYSYIQLFIPVCALGMNDIIVKQLVDDRARNEEILGTVIVLRISASLISMFCAVMIVRAFNDSPLYVPIAMLQSFSLLFQSFECLMYFYQSSLLSQKSGTAYALGYICSSLFRIIGILLKKDIYWFAWALSFDQVMAASLLIGAYLRDGHRLHFSLAMARHLLLNSRHYIIAGVLVVIYGKVTDILLLGKMVDDTAVGHYTAATALCNAWPFILTAIIDSLSPVIISAYSEDHELFKRKLRQLYALIFYISSAAALAILVLAPLIIRIIYGSEYENAVMPLRIVAFSTAFSYIGVARTIWIQCREMTRYESVISLFGALVSVAANYFLISRYGIIGASLAAVLTQFLTNFVFLFVMKDTRENAKLIWDAILLKGVFTIKEDHDVRE